MAVGSYDIYFLKGPVGGIVLDYFAILDEVALANLIDLLVDLVQ